MKIYAQHDSNGTIRSIITLDGPDGAALMLAQRPGIILSELEGVTFESNTPTPEELRSLAKSHRVAGAAQKRSLEKK